MGRCCCCCLVWLSQLQLEIDSATRKSLKSQSVIETGVKFCPKSVPAQIEAVYVHAISMMLY